MPDDSELVFVAGEVARWFMQQANINDRNARTPGLTSNTRDRLEQDASTYRKMAMQLDAAIEKARST